MDTNREYGEEMMQVGAQKSGLFTIWWDNSVHLSCEVVEQICVCAKAKHPPNN